MQRKPAVPRAKTEKKAEYGPHNSVLVLCHRQKFGLSHSLDRSENRIIDVTQRGEWRDDDHQPIMTRSTCRLDAARLMSAHL
jgi:hypothetical protein